MTSLLFRARFALARRVRLLAARLERDKRAAWRWAEADERAYAREIAARYWGDLGGGA